MAPNTDGWPVWATHLWNRVDDLAKHQVVIREDIAGLKVKSGVWGAIGGFISLVSACAIGGLIYLLKKAVP